MNKSISKRFSIILITFLFLMAVTGCSHEFILPENESMSKTGFYFDTIITITAYTSDFYNSKDPFWNRAELAQSRCDEYLDSCLEEATKYENLLSKTKEGSDIYNINMSGGKTVDVSPDTAYLLNEAVYYSDLSGGVFDPTIGVVTELWDFSADSDRKVPDEAAIKDAITHVNYKNIEITGEGENYSVTLKDPEAKIDLGGIAKGFIADKLKEKFLSDDIPRGIINLGGNVLLIGSKTNASSSSSDYVIGIQKPFGQTAETSAIVRTSDMSVVTSGIYDRYFTGDDGKIYHHILDSKTGYPVENEVLSATIISSSSTAGDALSTICLSLGTKKGMELISSIPDIQVLFIKDDYEIVTTEGFPLSK